MMSSCSDQDSAPDLVTIPGPTTNTDTDPKADANAYADIRPLSDPEAGTVSGGTYGQTANEAGLTFALSAALNGGQQRFVGAIVAVR